MFARLSITAAAIAAACASVQAQTTPPAQSVVVTSNPLNQEENLQVLTPAKVISGPELRNKLSTSLGDTLGQEPGVAASSFGAGASRPIIRGLEGPRVKILQNGMNVADVSALSNDHAVASDNASAVQIEILRGPATLVYGSGAIGGLVNVVDGRIPTKLQPTWNGEAELRYASVNQEKNASFSLDGASGKLGLHFSGHSSQANDYRIPGAIPRQINSDAQMDNLVVGASLIENWGHLGAAVESLNSRYGIPTEEKSFIKLNQLRFDVDALRKNPWAGFDSLQFKLGGNDYAHTEHSADGLPLTRFKNKSIESRLELKHANWNGWQGTWGLHGERSDFSALSAEAGHDAHDHHPDTVPATKSRALAAFFVEQIRQGLWLHSFGARYEHLRREPSTAQTRSFQLFSASAGTLWEFTPGFAAGLSVSLAQRAPTAEELYSAGPHEATASFDIGDAQLKKEDSRNFELSLQKTEGQWRWKINAYQNRVRNYVYGKFDGVKVDDTGTPADDAEFSRRNWVQAHARIRGIEAELAYNPYGQGWSGKIFTDASRGVLDELGNLPLQMPQRFGVDVAYKNGVWRGGMNILHAQAQARLASFEHYQTPAFTKLDFNLSYTQTLGKTQLTWFMLCKNALNQDMRIATSLLKEQVKQPGRNFIFGVRSQF